MNKLAAKKVKARWYDPRDGTWRAIGALANAGIREFVPPAQGARNDWVLVLEDAEKGYPKER